MNWSDFDQYIKPEHLKGKAVRLTVARVSSEEFYIKGKKEPAPVLWFEKTNKGLIVSNTNRRTLAAAYGDDANMLIGRAIILEPATVRVAGADKQTIRIKVEEQPK